MKQLLEHPPIRLNQPDREAAAQPIESGAISYRPDDSIRGTSALELRADSVNQPTRSKPLFSRIMLPEKSPTFRHYAVGLALTAQLFAAPAMAADKLTIILDWFVNPDHAPLIIAQEQGLFAKYGLDVELIPPSDAATPTKLVAAGQADLAIGYEPNLIMDVDQGLPLTRIGTLIEAPLNCLLVKADGPIKTIADLKGKKIGFSVSGFDDALLSVILEHAGLKLSDVELVNVNFSLTPSLLNGQVDAVIGGLRTFEAIQMQLEGSAPRVFPVEEFGLPAYDELIIEANTAKAKDPRFAMLMAAIEEASLYIANHPAESWALFIKNHKDLDDKLNQTAWGLTVPFFAKRPSAMDAGRYTRFAEFLKARGVIGQVKPADQYGVVVR